MLKTGFINYVGKVCVAGKIPHIKVRDGMGIIQTADILNQYFILISIGVVLFLCLLYFAGSVLLARGRILPAFAITLTILILGFSVYYLWVDPAANVYKTTKYFCEQSRKHLPPDAIVAYTGTWVDEAVFFIDRDYERCKIDGIYDAVNNKMKF
jgi:hypothetical protein